MASHFKEGKMFKNLIIVILLGGLVLMSYVAIRNCKPICNDLVRWQDDLICTYNLGNVQEDKADVIIVKVQE
jgi:hypothetical protein